ncbi:MAG: alpha/beta fold hydrolase [Rhizobiales bacterium]|nr:alpha/beta fold hydrolase [Hyphomicrobiales bacterium]
MNETANPGKLKRDGADYLAYLRDQPEKPAGPTGVTWLGGFKSDMTGTKASALSQWAQTSQRSFLRFDYFAHGQSSGDFADGTIGRWREDALAAFDALSEGPQIVVGSSMGGWIALLLTLARPERVKALVLIAPAPDFTEDLMWKNFPAEIQATIMRDGRYEQPSDYDDEPYVITRRLIEEGRQHLLLGAPIALSCPVRILQGMADVDVPWQHAMRLVEMIAHDDVTIHLGKSGDHRLSTPADINRLCHEIETLIWQLEA